MAATRRGNRCPPSRQTQAATRRSAAASSAAGSMASRNTCAIVARKAGMPARSNRSRMKSIACMRRPRSIDPQWASTLAQVRGPMSAARVAQQHAGCRRDRHTWSPPPNNLSAAGAVRPAKAMPTANRQRAPKHRRRTTGAAGAPTHRRPTPGGRCCAGRHATATPHRRAGADARRARQRRPAPAQAAKNRRTAC